MSSDATQALLMKYMMLETRFSAMTHMLTTLMARAASQYENPEEFIMTITTSIHAMVEEFDPEDEEMSRIGADLSDYADKVEANALSLLQ